mgnify:CR=1 FL=1
MLKIPYNYAFFVIWENGFKDKDQIIKYLRNEKGIEIIRIEKLVVDNIKEFVLNLYACDSVPLKHLFQKIKYLYKLRPEVLTIFVKNYNYQESVIGEGNFRKTQCKYIDQIKITIRNKFNPRHSDVNFKSEPLNVGVSHNHIIHSSDSEEQVDYFLKMLGYRKGIRLLEGQFKDLPFKAPYYLKRPKGFIFKTIPINRIKASILILNKDGLVSHEDTHIEKTPHFKTINSGQNNYENYLETFLHTSLLCDYSLENFNKLNALPLKRIKDFDRVIVKKKKDYFLILDGLHRTSILLNKGIKTINCIVFKY